MSGDSGTSEADELFWQDEVLEAIYWMVGEGIDEAVSPSDLQGFLDAPPGVVDRTFRTLRDRKLLEEADGEGEDAGGGENADGGEDADDGENAGGYVFTERGERVAAKRFADEFGDVQGFDAAHNDCGPDCWCHDIDHAEEPCPSEEHAHDH